MADVGLKGGRKGEEMEWAVDGNVGGGRTSKEGR